MKKIIIFALVIMTASCGFWKDDEQKLCPRVLIKRSDAYVVQKGYKHEDFLIEITGFEGYCYFDSKTKQDKAVINPIVKVKRLRPTDQTDVLFSFYVETARGPIEYLGKKTFHAMVRIPENVQEKEFTAQNAEVRIPPDMRYEFDVNLGLNISKNDKQYNQRTFDVPLGYKE